MNIHKEMNILIISHGFRLKSGGPAQDLRDFLKDKVEEVDYIDHPFPYADYNQTHFFVYQNGVLKSIEKSFPFFGPELLRYIQQFFVMFFFLLISHKKYDICFALDNHSLIAATFFRKIGKIKKLVYYSIDYVPKRFNNSLINSLYHLADRIACSNSDVNWVVAKHMIKARQDSGINLEKMSPFNEVPMGFHKNDIKLQTINKIDPFHLIYMGTLLEKQGLQLVIESLPIIKQDFPNIHLTILGAGNYEDELKNLTKKLKLTDIVNFKGFIGERDEMYSILTKSAIGLAPYKPIPDSFSYYADPSKIKIYLGCGLPVVTTKVTAFSQVIEEKQAGIVIDYSITSLQEAIKYLLQNRKTYANYRESAINLSKEYDTVVILKEAFYKL